MNLITGWLDFFISIVGDVVDYLGDFYIISGISILTILIVSFVAGIIMNAFVSRGKA